MTAAIRQQITEKADKAFRAHGAAALSVDLCGSSFVATFRSQTAARKGAAAMLGILKGIKVWESLDEIDGKAATIANRHTRKVWRIAGTI